MTDTIVLIPGMFTDVANDWRVFVVEADARHAGVMYVGSYPYAVDGTPLHPEAPAIAGSWDGNLPGARQISERQKRFERVMTSLYFEPMFQQQYA